MENISIVDLLLHEISKAKDLNRLLFLEDDVEISKGLGQIPNKQDQRILKLAMESRYSYIIFKEILTELEIMLENDGYPKLTLVKDFENKIK